MPELYRKGTPLSEGAENRVYREYFNPKRIIKERSPEARETPRRTIARYHLGKIAHLLFPEQIPDVYGAGTKPRTQVHVAYTPLDKYHKAANALKMNGAANGVERKKLDDLADEGDRAMEQDPLFGHFLRKMKEVGLEADDSPVNYTKFQGVISYVDSFTPWRGEGNWSMGFAETGCPERGYDAARLQQAVQRIHDPVVQEKALFHFYRLESLFLKECQEFEVKHQQKT